MKDFKAKLIRIAIANRAVSHPETDKFRYMKPSGLGYVH